MTRFLRNRIALASFAGAALTALGCSLIVDFDESKIPGEITDTGAETSTNETSAPDTEMPDTEMPDTALPDTELADTQDSSAPDTADSAAADTAMPDTADSAAPDTADTAMPDTADTAAPDTADTATPDTADTAIADTADSAPSDTSSGDTSTSDSGGDAATLSFAADIQPIFNANCNGCHIGGGLSGGLALDVGASYGNLVNVASTCDPSIKRVVPGSKTTSLIWLKTSNSTMKCGNAMPDGTAGLATTSPADFAKLEAWITQGALNN